MGNGPRRVLVAVTFALGLGGSTAAVRADESNPADGTSAVRELDASPDFRVRVSAALVVGKVRPPGARVALERALADAHPAVRVAAASALGALGDSAALPALERRLPAEGSASAQAQIRATIDRLRADPARREAASGPPAAELGAGVRFVVRIGAMRNRTGSGGEELSRVLLDSARTRARALRGGVVVEDGIPADASRLRLAIERRLPIIALDGNLTQLVESRTSGSAQVYARVEFTVRRDQSLKGTLSGGATSSGSGPDLSEQARRQLLDEAIDGAVLSALRGAEQGLIVAAR